MRTLVERNDLRSCHVSVVGTCKVCIDTSAVRVILIMYYTNSFSYSEYSTELSYFTLELVGCQTVKLYITGNLLILALSLTTLAGVTLQIKTPRRLRLDYPSGPI